MHVGNLGNGDLHQSCGRLVPPSSLTTEASQWLRAGDNGLNE